MPDRTLQDLAGGNPETNYLGGGLEQMGADLPPYSEETSNPPQRLDYENANRQFDNAVSLGNELGLSYRAQQAGDPVKSFQVTYKDGQPEYKAHLSKDAYDHIQQMMQIAQQAISARNQQIAEIQKKKDLIDQNPIIAQVGRLASLAAGQYYAPGMRGAALVRGAGLFGGETFGKTSEQLSGEMADLKTQNLGIEESVQQRLENLDRTLNEDKRTDALIEQNKQSQLLENRRQVAIETQRVEQRAEKIAASGLLTPDAEAQMKKEFVAAGNNPKDAEPWIAAYRGINAKAASDAAEEAKTKNQIVSNWTDSKGGLHTDFIDKDTHKVVSSLPVRQGPKTQELLDKEKEREEDDYLAAGLAHGDRESLKNLGGMGAGKRRVSIVAKAKMIAEKEGNKFETQDLENRIELFHNYTVPDPGGKNAASSFTQFNTLNEHIGEALDKIEAAGLTNSPLWQKPLNKWNETAEGRAAITALKAALQPVDEEYGTLIRAGKAPFKHDKDALDALFTADQKASQLIAVLTSSATTTSDRVRELMNTYKRGTGQEFKDRLGEGPVSPEAQRTLIRLGVPFVGGPTRQEMAILNDRTLTKEQKAQKQADLPPDQRSDGGRPQMGGGGGF